MNWLRNRLSPRHRGERGAVLVLAAAGMVMAVVSASLAVDLGALAHEARRDQKVADLAALDAVRVLPGVLDQTAPGSVTQAAKDSAARNNSFNGAPRPWAGTGYSLTVLWAPTALGPFTNSTATLPIATAVQVTAVSPQKNHFPFTTSPPTVSRKGVATLGNGQGCSYPDACEPTPGLTETSVSPLGTVRVGSSVATISSPESTILDTLLTKTLGGSYTLSAVGWQGLAAGNVSVRRLQAALVAGSPTGVLDSSVKYRRLLDATVDALNADGSPSSITAKNFLVSIRNQVTATAGADVQIRRLLDLVGNFGSGRDVADATINVKDIVVGGMIVADGRNFVSMDLTAGDIPGLPPGITTVKFGLIDAPQEKSGPAKTSAGVYRTTAATAQIRLLIESNVVAPIPLLGSINLKIPYYLEGAGATASLDTLTCPAGATVPTSVKILGQTTVAKTSVGTVSNAGLTSPSGATVTAGPATIGALTALGVTLNVTSSGSVVSSVPGHSGLLTFTPPYDGATSQPVPGTTALTLPTAMDGNLTITLSALPIGLTLAGVQSAIYAAVNPTLAPLNNLLVKPLQRALGLSLGAADIWAPPVQTCAPTSFNTDPTPSVDSSHPFGVQNPSLVG